MLTQSYLPCSIEDDLCFVSDFGEKGCFFDWMPTAETWQMDSKCEMNHDFGTGTEIGNSSGQQKGDGGCSLVPIQSCSQLSAVSHASESSAPNFVYQRKRLQKNHAALSWANITLKTSLDDVSFVYERKKHQQSVGTNFSALLSANASNGACSSAIKSHEPTAMAAMPLEKIRGMPETEDGRVSSVSAIVSNKELPFTSLNTVDGVSFDNRSSDLKAKTSKTIELCSADDSCSSSLVNMDVSLVPLKTETDDTDECSSSGVLVTDMLQNDSSLSAKGLCVSILLNYGLLNRTGLSEEDVPSCSGSSCSRSCNACGRTGIAIEMLICDECEEAFHLSCFNPSIKKIPTDNWYCQPCAKKKQIMIKERAVRKSSIIGSGNGSVTSEGHSSIIEMMLKDTQPYMTSVRVGKGFQAIVPEWSGPVTEDIEVLPEPLVLDSSSAVNQPGLVHGKRRRSSFIGNWLQCREVITGTGNGLDGTVCGKWRRAPLFEVQTDKWDCFRSVLWDPAHADCAVPQELETEEVMKQLKYIELLRPRLSGKRRRLEICNVTGADSEVPTEEATVETV